MTQLYMLDTNIASHIIKGDIPAVRDRLLQLPMHCIAISAVTEGELLYGVAKRGHPRGLSERVVEFLRRVETLPWTEDVARCYGDFRAHVEASGKSLSSLDMMIAAHAVAVDATLVTRDGAFAQVAFNMEMPKHVQGARGSVFRIADWSI